MTDRLLKTWEDGHTLLQDRWQWILHHPATCRNARRGNLSWQYAKATYFSDERFLKQEQDACGLFQ